MLPHTLFGRLLIVFLVFGVAMTAALLVVMQGSHRLYHLEADQIVNRDLAERYVAGNFLLAETPLTAATLHRGLARLAAANPDVDLYLLEDNGRIVAASVPQVDWQRAAVKLTPVHDFLRGRPAPILGDDPRDAAGQEIFSAAPLQIADCPAKYLYVVLHQGDHVAAASRLRAHYAIGEGAGVLLVASVLAVVLSLIVVRLLTRRLSLLDQAMQRFCDSGDGRPDPTLQGGARSGDEIDRLTAMCHALSARVRAQMQVLQSADEMRREVLANVSHDLLTPLTTLQAHLETLAMPASTLLPAERVEYVQISLGQTRRLITLVEQLIEASKLDAHQVVPHLEAFQVGELLYDIAQKFSLAASDHGVALQVDAPVDTPRASGDIALIERVLDNLIDNALRHTPRGGRVSLGLSLIGQRIRIDVQDTGAGMTVEGQERAFQRFYRADPSRGSDGGHAGLGLAIVKSILDLHGATIHVASKPGAGARFWFELPTESVASDGSSTNAGSGSTDARPGRLRSEPTQRGASSLASG